MAPTGPRRPARTGVREGPGVTSPNEETSTPVAGKGGPGVGSKATGEPTGIVGKATT